MALKLGSRIGNSAEQFPSRFVDKAHVCKSHDDSLGWHSCTLVFPTALELIDPRPRQAALDLEQVPLLWLFVFDRNLKH